MTDEQIKHMAERFLCWKLPEDFHPDAGLDCTPWDVEVGAGPAITFCANGLLQESTITDDGVELSALGLAVRQVLEQS